MKKAFVAIVGRPNVGKSTLFNRIIKSRHSIVDDQPGVTRDRIYQQAEWLTRNFWLIDTGGITWSENDLMQNIKMQAEIAIEQADTIIFVTNFQEGLTSEDSLIAKILYKSKKPIILAINKYDNLKNSENLYEFRQLGFKENIAVSSNHGIGIGDLLDKVINTLPISVESDELTTKFAIVGRPNVGKSSLTNAILKSQRVIVSPNAGTTTDAIDTIFQYQNDQYLVIDTAGIRRKGKISEKLEKYSVLRAIHAIERSDVVLLMLDGSVEIREQDSKIASIAFESYKPIVIVVNKWDLVSNKEAEQKKMINQIHEHFKFLSYALIIFISAKNSEKINSIFTKLKIIKENSKLRIQTSVLNEILTKAQLINQSPIFNGDRLKIYYGSQVSVEPVTFVLFVNSSKYLHFSYERFLENQIRNAFGFEGVPIKLIFRDRSKK